MQDHLQQLNDAIAARLGLPAEEKAEDTPKKRSTARRTLLIVEDEQDCRLLIKGMLADRSNWRIIEAGDGPSALAHLAHEHVDLVILDFGIPITNGFEVLQELRSRAETRTLSVIMMSGARNRRNLKAMNLDVSDFLEKPFSTHEMLASIDKVMAALPEAAPSQPASADPDEDPAEVPAEAGPTPPWSAASFFPAAGIVLPDIAAAAKAPEAPTPQPAASCIDDQAHRRRQEEFLGQVTHDLQAPLTSINCALNLLVEKAGAALGSEEQEYLEICLRNGQRLATMIRDILDLSKLSAGKMIVHLTPTSLTGILREATESLQPWARSKRIVLSCRFPEPDLLVLADQKRIVQVLTNLIANALKYSPEGGQVSVSASLSPDRPGSVVCSVCDSGCGLSPQARGLLFERFAQAEDRDGGQPGVGLGLALVKQFVKLHGGAVWAQSEAGQGSTFYFSLPSPEKC